MNKPTELRSDVLARNTTLNILGQAIPAVIGFFTVPYVLGKLGPDHFGLLSLVWALLSYFTVFDLGLGRATTKFVAEALGKGESDGLPRVVWTAVGVQIIVGSIASIILVGIVPLLVDRLLNLPPSLSIEAKQIFFLVALAIPIVLVAGSLRGVLEASQRFDLVNAVKVPASSLNFLLPALGVSMGFGVPGIVLLLLLAWAGNLAAFIFINLRLNPHLRTVTIAFPLFKRLFSFGGWVTLSSIANPLFYYLERFVIASTLTVGVLTYYAIPYEVISRLVIVPASFAATLFPAFSFYGSENQTKIKQLLSRPIRYLVLIAGPVVVVFIVYAHQILVLWLGEEFAQQGARVLQILALTFFFHALAHVPFTAIQGLGRPDLKAKFDMAMLVVFIGLCFWLVPQQGIIGAAIAKFILTVADVTFLSRTVLRLSKLSLGDVLTDGMKKTSLLVGSFAVVNIVLAAFSSSLLMDFFILGGSSLLYVALLFRFIADEKDKEAFQSVQQYFLSIVKRAS